MVSGLDIACYLSLNKAILDYTGSTRKVVIQDTNQQAPTSLTMDIFKSTLTLSGDLPVSSSAITFQERNFCLK